MIEALREPGQRCQPPVARYRQFEVRTHHPDAIALVGAGSGHTIIDASGRANGIYVDGQDNSGMRSVVVSGFQVKNANFEGILIVNASDVVVRDNVLTGND
ncbi:MAG TPA: hypothetical protein VN730_14820 [Steroidobacteraceae bacterium]|nr:hypothetical protein [Steroidobacteraceae bacterium]